MNKSVPILFSFLMLASLNFGLSAQSNLRNLHWKSLVHNQPAEWYRTDEAKEVAENVLLYQRDIGGWPKNTEMHLELSPGQKEELKVLKSSSQDVTTDNGATTTEMNFLSKIYKETHDRAYKKAFLKGLDYLLEAQYENGGWPQFYPLREGYYSHITYNDNSMVNIMNVLKAVKEESEEISVRVKKKTRLKAGKAFDKGIEIILKTQYRQNGELTVWCAQHDEVTLEPAQARSYELPSLSGSESASIVLLLMEIDKPSPEIIYAIQSAVKWFDKTKILGMRIEDYTNEHGDRDRRSTRDEHASAIWARFYDLSDNRPFFSSRDGIKKYSLDEISYERRNGYGWYSDAPRDVFKKYKKWQPVWAPDNNVLTK
ncbi:MAG: pectate lyase [Bacteroidales bacterium]|nr:pectate lyase [Bacteroidales bacterium]MCF8391530.1 pectate lyase [Bacteroidales bacterium]